MIRFFNSSHTVLCLLVTLSILMFHHGKIGAQSYLTNTYTLNISEISLIRIDPLVTINMSLLASTAGVAPAPQTDFSTYLQVTSIATSPQTRRITASYTGTMPAGTYMTINAGTCTTGSGNRGIPNPTIILNGTAQTIINNIASGYTGSTLGNGFKITYSWQIDPSNYHLISAVKNAPLLINYTIIND